MTTTGMPPRQRLGELLMEAGLLDETQLNEALAFQREAPARLGQVLVRRGFLDEETVTIALAQQLNLPPVHLDSAPISPKVTRWLPYELAQRYRAFPLSADRRQRVLRVATSDPRPDAAEALSYQTGMRVLFFFAGEAALTRALARYYRGEATPTQGVRQADLAVGFPRGQGKAPADPNLANRMARLERLVLQQGFALRGMLELLDQKGVIGREEFLNRLEPGKKNQPPPLPLGRTAKSRPALPLRMENKS